MSGVSTIGQTVDQISRFKTLQTDLGTLQTQLATGKKASMFSGLGTDTIISERARARVNAVDTYMNNITIADRRMKEMLNGIEETQAQIGNIEQSLTVAMQNGEYPELPVIQDLAANARAFIVDLINKADGDRYLFAGADSATKPLTDTGLFESYLGEFMPDETDLTNPPLVNSGMIGQWGNGSITTEEFIQSYRNVNETTLGYSASLSNDVAGDVYVRVDDMSEFKYTSLGDSKGFKDALIAIGVIEQLPPPEYAPGALNDPTATTLGQDTQPFPPTEKQENFFQVIQDLAQMLSSASDALDNEVFKLEQVRANIGNIKESHSYDKNTHQSIIADVENANMTEIATQINFLQIQLEASFSVTAALSELSLARFL